MILLPFNYLKDAMFNDASMNKKSRTTHLMFIAFIIMLNACVPYAISRVTAHALQAPAQLMALADPHSMARLCSVLRAY